MFLFQLKILGSLASGKESCLYNLFLCIVRNHHVWTLFFISFRQIPFCQYFLISFFLLLLCVLMLQTLLLSFFELNDFCSSTFPRHRHLRRNNWSFVIFAYFYIVNPKAVWPYFLNASFSSALKVVSSKQHSCILCVYKGPCVLIYTFFMAKTVSVATQKGFFCTCHRKNNKSYFSVTKSQQVSCWNLALVLFQIIWNTYPLVSWLYKCYMRSLRAAAR